MINGNLITLFVSSFKTYELSDRVCQYDFKILEYIKYGNGKKKSKDLKVEVVGNNISLIKYV